LRANTVAVRQGMVKQRIVSFPNVRPRIVVLCGAVPTRGTYVNEELANRHRAIHRQATAGGALWGTSGGMRISHGCSPSSTFAVYAAIASACSRSRASFLEPRPLGAIPKTCCRTLRWNPFVAQSGAARADGPLWLTRERRSRGKAWPGTYAALTSLTTC